MGDETPAIESGSVHKIESNILGKTWMMEHLVLNYTCAKHWS